MVYLLIPPGFTVGWLAHHFLEGNVRLQAFCLAALFGWPLIVTVFFDADKSAVGVVAGIACAAPAMMKLVRP